MVESLVFLVPVIPIVLLRVCEPYVFQELTIQVRKLCRKDSTSNKTIKYSDESLDTFLNSSMNVQYVVTILVGINNQMMGYQEQQIEKISEINYEEISIEEEDPLERASLF